MRLPDFKGLKFPDENVTRFFFKSNFHNTTGNVSELGCGNGNNLRLFYEYGWNVTGVDINSTYINDANTNFSNLNCKNSFDFHLCNMTEFLRQTSNKFDVILLPNSIYYLEEKEIRELISLFNKIVKDGAYLFIIVRTIEDCRFKNYSKIDSKTVQITDNDTGENNCQIVFFNETTLMKLFDYYFVLTNKIILNKKYDVLIDGKIIKDNSDLIIWGNINFN